MLSVRFVVANPTARPCVQVVVCIPSGGYPPAPIVLTARADWFHVKRLVLTVSVVAWMLSAANAHAYIDPGTGSYHVQMIAALLGGVALTVRQIWARIRLRSHRRKAPQSETVSAPSAHAKKSSGES
jgi:hypothetical protein